MNGKHVSWTYVVLGVVVLALSARVVQVTNRWMSAERGKVVSDSLLFAAESALQASTAQDESDAVQRVRDQFIIDSLGGVIQFQTRALGQWERAKTTLHPVDTSLTLDVQLVQCRDNEIMLRASAEALASSLARATDAGNAAVAQATKSKLRADSADARRQLASDSISQLLVKAKAATTRRWYQKLWGGTKQVVTTTVIAGAGYAAGKLF